jgi:hypothetical protein
VIIMVAAMTTSSVRRRIRIHIVNLVVASESYDTKRCTVRQWQLDVDTTRERRQAGSKFKR